MRLTVFCAVAAFGLPGAVVAQESAIQGIVASSVTGRPLESAEVTLEVDGERAYGAVTDRNGFYQIGNIEPGRYTLRGRLIGYAPHEQVVSLSADERVTVSFRLEPAAEVLEGIIVAEDRGAAVRDLGRQIVRPTDLGRIPVPAGAGDLASYLQTLPGVTTTGDRGGQLFVRGGTPSDNMVLVDGIPIYQPFHILGFFSVFPEDLVSTVDYYAGGFGARYSGRTSSVVDVRIREGDPNGHRAIASAGPFIAEAIVEGPAEGAGITWLASVRRSLIEETSGALLGTTQPLTFDSQLLKVTSALDKDDRCSALALRTSDRGRLDPDESQSHVSWSNLLFGMRCVKLQQSGRLLEVNFSYSSSGSEAVSRGSSNLDSRVRRTQHDAHVTGMIRSIPIQAGYHTYLESMAYELSELFSGQGSDDDAVFGVSAYAEAAVSLGSRIDVRPGVVLAVSPKPGLEPRLRASWEPFGRSSEQVQAAFGLYRQNTVGTSDMRDVSSVFVAWMSAPDGDALEALHGSLGWQQTLGDGLRWSIEGYYKQLKQVPVPVWRGVAQFTTTLGRADGEVHGADARVEYTTPRFYAFLGYGYGWTEYQASQAEFSTWFGEPVQNYHPAHDRRHQINAITTLEIGDFEAAVRWQFGSGLPFTRPIGFDEAFDYSQRLHDVHTEVGTPRLVLDRPFTGRLPLVHRLDVSLEREFDVSFGRLVVQAGVINAYDRTNMFYYDLSTGRRVDQLPLAPYASVTLR
ncbi:MAG: TonB-dependent receptor [Gemmatimonadota bacterium]